MQAVPYLARDCGELYVFQRTPSSVDVRDNRPTDPEWFAEMATPGWQKRWLENFTAIQTAMVMPEEDLVQDGWTDLAQRIRSKIMALPPDQWTPENMMAAFEDSDFEKMSEIRDRVDAIVTDAGDGARTSRPGTASCASGRASTTSTCRPTTSPTCTSSTPTARASKRVTETGLVVAGKEYELDCIIYASGFEVGTPFTRRAGFDMVGVDGLKLSEAWADGMRTKHGIHVHGFPNAFIVQIGQGANLVSNVPHNFTEAAATIAAIVRHALDGGHDEVEVTKEAQDEWMELLYSAPRLGIIGSAECTPGYYNNEGKTDEQAPDWFLGYPARRRRLLRVPRHWRDQGRLRRPRVPVGASLRRR